MAIITLTTDWISTDYYVGAVKGCILSHFAAANIVDISHQISPFHSTQAAFILKNSFVHFPGGTVHVLDVNSEVLGPIVPIAIQYNNQFFIGTDDGCFGLIFRDPPQAIVRIEKFFNDDCSTFPALHIFAPAAAHLASGKPLAELGSLMADINRHTMLRATIGDNVIAGSVVYMDSYQNGITNISKDLFDRVGQGRRVEILVLSNRYKITKINKTYNESSSGELLAIFNSAGLLEIAINLGNAAQLLNLGVNSNVRVKFLD
jgi:S-adenosyl-L-methionine hydrolase (adenosine-forming)